MTIKEKQQEIIDEFGFLDDWEQKYEYIIDLGKELKGLPEEKKTWPADLRKLHHISRARRARGFSRMRS